MSTVLKKLTPVSFLMAAALLSAGMARADHEDQSNYTSDQYSHSVHRPPLLLSVGNRVVDASDGHTGTIKAIANTGQLVILYDIDTTRLYIRWPNQVFPEHGYAVDYFRGFRSGDRVIDNLDGHRGTVISVKSNGELTILYDVDPSRHYKRSIGQVTKQYDSSRIRIGARVIDNSDKAVGTVINKASDGLLIILYDIDQSRYYHRYPNQVTLGR